MDTVTHALTGAALSDALFRRRLGPLATPFSLIVAALPDADMVTFFFSPESAWAHHRGYTHSLFPMLVAAPIFGYAGYRASRRQGSWRLWTLLAILCLFSHTFLDIVTSWGTMPLLPFSRARISWDMAPVLDVFMFSLTLASFVANRLLRWERKDVPLNPVAFPVVHKHPTRTRVATWVTRVALVLAVLYFAVGFRQNRQAVSYARDELAGQGITATEVRALPVMFTYIAWQIAARTEDGTVYNGAYSSYAPKAIEFKRYDTLSRAEIRDILSTKDGDMFAWYSQNMFVASKDGGSADGKIRLADRRFWGLMEPQESRFAMNFEKDATGRWHAERAAHARLNRNVVRDEFVALWRLTWRGELPGVKNDILPRNAP